jgi:hypothetical protein
MGEQNQDQTIVCKAIMLTLWHLQPPCTWLGYWKGLDSWLTNGTTNMLKQVYENGSLIITPIKITPFNEGC